MDFFFLRILIRILVGIQGVQSLHGALSNCKFQIDKYKQLTTFQSWNKKKPQLKKTTVEKINKYKHITVRQSKNKNKKLQQTNI